MELVTLYMKNDYRSIFYECFRMWSKGRIQSTPDMATLIEKQGITRHMIKKDLIASHNVQDMKTFYKGCLAFLIYYIDEQAFDHIDNIFAIERGAVQQLETDRS